MDDTGLDSLLTPALILDADVMARNCECMRDIARRHGVSLRPHAKTAKSVDALDLALGGRREALAVSTLAEAGYFGRAGFRDLLYAVGIAPGKLPYVERLMREEGVSPTLVTDDLDTARAAALYAERRGIVFDFVAELDCGAHRGGVECAGERLLELARVLDGSGGIRFRGVMTHAGQAYETGRKEEIQDIAAREAACVADSARMLRQAGIAVEIASVGSTPTAIFSNDLDGVTEMRPGVFMFFDLDQMSRGVCHREDIALSVLATVIGHSREGRSILVDAGGLALSKDLGANRFMPEAGYGLVCDPRTLEPLGGLCVRRAHQEHGFVPVPDKSWFERLPVGGLVRILPNHACMTAAAYSEYVVLRGGRVDGTWARINGWRDGA